MTRRALWLAALALALAPRAAFASPASTFGQGTRDAALAGSDVADPDPSESAYVSPASAATPGARLAIGYRASSIALRLSGAGVPVRDVSGVELGVQLARGVGEHASLGFAFAMQMPDGWLARVAFRPATEAKTLRWDDSLQRTSVDAAVAVAVGAFSLGGGVTAAIDTGGRGVDVSLGQDARGSYAETRSDVSLGYRVAPIASARFDAGKVVAAARYRGAIGLGLDLVTRSTIDLGSNPLDGTTGVAVRGTSAYDPATLDVALSARLRPWLAVHGALQWQRWSAAPAPAAEIDLDVRLGTIPWDRVGAAAAPELSNVLSPRLGVELAPRGEAAGTRVLAGWALLPSPLAPSTGVPTWLDATAHVVSLGASQRLGRAFGAEFLAGLAAQAHLLVERRLDKPIDAVPHAHETFGGRAGYAAASLEVRFR